MTGYLAQRRTYVYGTLAARPGEVLAVRVADDAAARWRVPHDDAEDWTTTGFDDGAWSEGSQPLGYEDAAADYAGLLQTYVRPQDADPAATSVQARAVFEVADAAVIGRLILRVKYDDGFVAWLNGVEVARRNVDGAPTWDGDAADHADALAVRYEEVELGAFADLLNAGENVLALQVINAGADSDDLILGFELIDRSPDGGGPIPGPQAEDALVEIGTIDPSPGAPAEAYITVTNPAAEAIDMSGWRLAGAGIEHVFEPGTVVPVGGTLYVVADARAFRRRAEGPSGGQGLFVQGNWRGALRVGPEAPAVFGPDGVPHSP